MCVCVCALNPQLMLCFFRTFCYLKWQRLIHHLVGLNGWALNIDESMFFLTGSTPLNTIGVQKSIRDDNVFIANLSDETIKPLILRVLKRDNIIPISIVSRSGSLDTALLEKPLSFSKIGTTVAVKKEDTPFQIPLLSLFNVEDVSNELVSMIVNDIRLCHTTSSQHQLTHSVLVSLLTRAFTRYNCVIQI